MSGKRALALLILTAASAAGDPGIAGRWIGYFGATLHTWDFKADGTFSHVFIATGSGTRLLNEEKGNFAVEAESLVLSNVTSASGMVAPDRDGHNALLGGAKSKVAATRRVKFKVVEPGTSIMVEGTKLRANR